MKNKVLILCLIAVTAIVVLWESKAQKVEMPANQIDCVENEYSKTC